MMIFYSSSVCLVHNENQSQNDENENQSQNDEKKSHNVPSIDIQEMFFDFDLPF